MSTDRIQRLWGYGDIDQMFPGSGFTTTTPWPRGDRVRHGQAYDHDAVSELVRHPVELVDLDSRDLRCSQPSLVREHVAYYLTGRWEFSGRTSADQHAEHNRFPLIVNNHAGRSLILAGHHRTAAALIGGRPVRARVAALTSDFFVTPHLRVEPTCAPSFVAAEAAAQIRQGVVRVPSLEAAGDVLRLAGAPAEDVSLAIEFAGRRLGSGDEAGDR
jgi:hypothetical protein